MIRTLICAVVAILLVASAHAQTDHLECFRVKDSQRTAVYTTRLAGLAPPHGCVVRLPAKLMCVPTVQLETSPLPPGAPTGANAGAFLCYKVRCRRNALPRLTVADQFGRRIVRPQRSRLLCAPLPASTVGSETSSSTTTTLPGGQTTSTTTRPTSTVPPSTSPSSTSPPSTSPPSTVSTSTTIPVTTTTNPSSVSCAAPNTSCGSCGNGACQPQRPNGELICAYQPDTGFCQGQCQSTGECPPGRVCVGASGDAGTCCTPCH